MIEMIRGRRSVRTFSGEALRGEDARQIIDFARMVENPYDLPIEWKLLDAEKERLNSPVITGAGTYLAGKMRRTAHAEEAFGYTFEKIALFAETLGVGSTCIAGTMNRPAFERAMALSDGEVLPCVTPLGYPAEKMSLREKMMRKGIRADSRLRFEELFFDASFQTPLTPERAGGLRLPLEMVRLAPSAVNRQPWRVVVNGNEVLFYEKRDKGFLGSDGWDLQRIDMGIALCHFALAAEECGISASLCVDAPAAEQSEELICVAAYTIT